MPINLQRLGLTSQKYMPDEVTIYRDVPGDLDDVTLARSSERQELYAGKARVSPMGSPGRKVLAEAELASTSYEIAIPLDDTKEIEFLPNDFAVVATSNDEALLIEDTVLIVRGIIPGTYSVDRRLSCFLDVKAY